LNRELVTGFSTLRGDYILIVEAHVCDAADVQARMKEARSLFEFSGVRRVLVDASHVVSVWNDDELHSLAELARIHVGWAERIALARTPRSVTDKFRQLVDSFATMGVPIRLFQDLDEARTWLES
jgi:hypothetical protein